MSDWKTIDLPVKTPDGEEWTEVVAYDADQPKRVLHTTAQTSLCVMMTRETARQLFGDERPPTWVTLADSVPSVRAMIDMMRNDCNRVSEAVVIVDGRHPLQRLVNHLIGDMVRLTAIQAADAACDRLAVAPKHGPRNRWGGLK